MGELFISSKNFGKCWISGILKVKSYETPKFLSQKLKNISHQSTLQYYSNGGINAKTWNFLLQLGKEINNENENLLVKSGEPERYSPLSCWIDIDKAFKSFQNIKNWKISYLKDKEEKAVVGEFSVKKGFLKNFAELTGKKPVLESLFNKVARLSLQVYQKETPEQVFSFEF